MDKKDRLAYLVESYFKNICSQQEMNEFLDYVQDAKYDALINDLLQKMWDDQSTRALLTADTSRVRLTEAVKKPVNKQRLMYILLGMAASVSIILFIGLRFYFEPLPKQLAVNTMPVTSKSTQEEHRVITAPDGSTIWLNSNSELDYPATFSGLTREVTLRGEAFFDIKHDSLRPFIIHTGMVQTTVLGTAFNIRAFPSEPSITVAVTRGKVRVGDDKNETELTANQQVSFDRVGKTMKQQTTESEKVASWTREDLIMDNITFAEAVTIIEDRYKINVEFQKTNLKNCRFTSTFLKDASLEQMLTAICIVNRATFTREGQKVIVDGEGCETEAQIKP